MAIFKVGELPQREGSEALEPDKRVKSYRRAWLVCPDETAGTGFATNAEKYGARYIAKLLPVKIGDAYKLGTSGQDWYETDAFVYVNRLDVRQVEEDGANWFCTAEYGVVDPNRKDNPLDEPPVVSWDFIPYERILDEDIKGVPIVNTAGDPFDPPIVIDDPRLVLTITVNRKKYDPVQAWNYRNVLNEDTFYGSPPLTVKCMPPRGTRAFNSECGEYWVIQYEMHFEPDGWQTNILNIGTRQLNTGKTAYEHILTGTGQMVSDPVPLDENGRAYTSHSTPPLVLSFSIYKTKKFAPLNLEPPA